MPTLEVKEDFPVCTMRRKASWELKREEASSHNKCGNDPQTSVVGAILAKSCTCILISVQGLVRCEERDDWSNVNKEPEGLSYISN